MDVSITQNNLGFTIVMSDMINGSSFLLHSERSKKQRVFKTAEAALKVCKQLGYNRVTMYMP